MCKNIWQVWEKHLADKKDSDAIIHWIAGKKPVRWTYAALIEKAKLFAVVLKNHGVKKDEVCALIVRHHPDFYPLYMSVVALGAIPAVLAYPNPRLHPEKFRQGIEGMSQRSGLDHILTEAELLPMLLPLFDKKGSTIKSVFLPLEEDLSAFDVANFTPPELRPENDPFLLQHSSGTTGLQKPVIISHHALLFHAMSYGEALKINSTDKFVSWLPLYHDMGLIATFHLPLIWGIPSVQINPFDWILAPEILVEATAKENGTVILMPNFAFHLMASKVHDDDILDYNLKCIRLLINSSEPIRAESFERFTQKFTKFGFNSGAYSTLYGMAETTMAVTQTYAGEKPACIKADRNALTMGFVKTASDESFARVCIASGKLIKGCEVSILDDNRNPLPSGRVGELAIKSVALFEGYRNYPEKTAEVMHKGWYLSGDIGFENDGHFYIIARKKDTIISAGKNVYPEDVEDIINKIDAVIPGRVIAFGEDDIEMGTELISILAETQLEDADERKALKLKIIKAAMSIDVTVTKVYLVPPRWLIKSSAGKPGRLINKERILEESENVKWRT